MANDLKITLFVSLAVHASIFLVTSFAFRRSTYVVLPVELFFYNPPAALAVPAPSLPAPVHEVLQKTKEKEEVTLPSKKKEKLRPQVAPPSETKPQTQTPAPSAPAGADTSARNLSPANQISLDTARFPFTYYTNTIVRKISRSWQWSTGFGQLKTVLYFKIQRDGSVAAVKVKKASGDRYFDQQAVRSIELSSPFPPLPDGYDGDDLGVYFEFGFK